ncbi:MAG: hypothetical protein IIZ35_03340 [Clostridia bacterium]|nr:hypothetical protein [Clostridia bacterium]
MKLSNDMHYVNSYNVERGLIRAVPFQVRFDRYFTEEEMVENRAAAERLGNGPAWVARCEEFERKISDEIREVIKHLSTRYKLGQYDPAIGSADCDLWFYCRMFDNVPGDRYTDERRNYSYVTLSFMYKDQNVDDHERIFDELREILAEWDAPNVQAIFQFAEMQIPENVEREAERIYTENDGKFCVWSGFTVGRLGRDENGYFFKKKGAKRYGYRLTSFDVCHIAPLCE